MMLYTTLLLAALASFVAAQNAFTMDGPSSIAAGTPYNITWAPSADSKTVSLFLRQGEPKALTTVATIASSIKNTGSYLWTPPSTLPSGTNYAFEIVDGSDPNINNYSGQFAIDSTNTAAPAATSHSATEVIVPTTSTSSLTDAKKETSTSSVAATDSPASVKSATSTAVKSKEETANTTAGKETSSASKKNEATKTGTSTATATDSGTSSTATKNAAGPMRASGALLGLGVVGGLMAAL